jgi:hypothetical protein
LGVAYDFWEKMPLVKRTRLIQQLQDSQHDLTRLLLSVADNQDWRPAPDQWSFRYHAAHLAVTDQEAFWPRLTRIASGENPQFEYYRNSQRDFSRHDLRDSLAAWAVTRRHILNFVADLPESKLTLSGVHATFGVITVLDTLQIMIDHDLEHLSELKSFIRVRPKF